jgi:uncharacterized protein DUF4338
LSQGNLAESTLTGRFPNELDGEIIRGRCFSTFDLQLIRRMVEEYFDEGRTRISVKICEELDWRQPNGWLKDRACRDVLRTLERRRFLVLPPLKSNPIGNSRRKPVPPKLTDDITSTELSSLDFSKITIEQVKGTKNEEAWNWLVSEYHYLGFSVLVGKALKYLARYDGRVIGAWSISDCAWAIEARDSILQVVGLSLREVRLRVVNNSRFLILPWVKVPNLASHLLSLMARTIKIDWKDYYLIEPLLIETFVEDELFLGTCYKAANWLRVGQTKGYRKHGSFHHNSQTCKSIFLYPLNRRLRSELASIPENRTDA